MPKQVLSVGQCSIDDGQIARFLRKHFDVTIDRAPLPDDAMQKLRDGQFDLVIVNRKLDEDYSDGMDVIRALKADDDFGSLPVMLVSNYPDAQQAAVAAGAEHGFGKSEFDSPAVISRLARFLK